MPVTVPLTVTVTLSWYRVCDSYRDFDSYSPSSRSIAFPLTLPGLGVLADADPVGSTRTSTAPTAATTSPSSAWTMGAASPSLTWTRHCTGTCSSLQ